MMTPKQKLEMHKRIVQGNARKLRDWREYPKTWKEQVETRLLNLRIAEEALQEMRDMGVIE